MGESVNLSLAFFLALLYFRFFFLPCVAVQRLSDAE